jgi:hypothetical protein
MKCLKVLPCFLILACAILTSCDDEDDNAITPDKMTRLMITQSNFMVLESSSESEIYLGYLTDFSSSDFTSIESVKFVVMGACNSTADKTYEVLLYDLTNKKIIDDSGITFQPGECGVNGYSNDIKGSFPNQRIDLGIMVKGVDVGSFWGSYLYIYRK